MATFSQLATIASDSGFQSRVKYAMAVAALAIYNEALNTPGHSTRAKLAVNILSGTFNFTFCYLSVLTNSTIAAEANPSSGPDFSIPDSDIQFQVNSMWNAIAGA